jgi:CheY-like chemotaxis protein
LEKGKHFDIYCLDIFMPGFTGIEVAKEIRALDKTAPIVFFHHRGNLLWRAMQ